MRGLSIGFAFKKLVDEGSGVVGDAKGGGGGISSLRGIASSMGVDSGVISTTATLGGTLGGVREVITSNGDIEAVDKVLMVTA